MTRALSQSLGSGCAHRSRARIPVEIGGSDPRAGSCRSRPRADSLERGLLLAFTHSWEIPRSSSAHGRAITEDRPDVHHAIQGPVWVPWSVVRQASGGGRVSNRRPAAAEDRRVEACVAGGQHEIVAEEPRRKLAGRAARARRRDAIDDQSVVGSARLVPDANRGALTKPGTASARRASGACGRVAGARARSSFASVTQLGCCQLKECEGNVAPAGITTQRFGATIVKESPSTSLRSLA